MKLVKQLLLVGAGVVFALSMNAQSSDTDRVQRGKEGKKGDRMEKVKEELGLTDDQATAWEAINEKYRAEHQKTKDANEGKRAAIKEEMEAIREAHDAEVAAILTPEQLVKWNEIKEEREARRNERKEKQERAR